MNLRVFYLYKTVGFGWLQINGHHVNLHYNDGRLK